MTFNPKHGNIKFMGKRNIDMIKKITLTLLILAMFAVPVYGDVIIKEGNDLIISGGATVSTNDNVPTWESGGIHMGMPFSKNENTSGGYGTIKIFSNDSCSPEAYLQGTMALMTAQDESSRRLKIECIEQGTAYRTVTINEGGGNVGIGITKPPVQLTLKSLPNSTGYTEMLRLEGQSLANGWERGIAFTGNDGVLEVGRITAYLDGLDREVRFYSAGILVMALEQDGSVRVPSLAGNGTRSVVVDSSGVLSAP